MRHKVSDQTTNYKNSSTLFCVDKFTLIENHVNSYYVILISLEAINISL